MFLNIFKRCMALLLGLLYLSVSATRAEEGGSGHYLPGSVASSIDATLPGKAFVVRLNVATYQGQVAKGLVVPIAGLATANAEIDVNILGLTLAWNPGLDLGPKWSYAMSTTLPWVDLTVRAQLIPDNLPAGVPIPSAAKLEDTEQGLGDLVLIPAMFSYQIQESWRSDFRLSLYAPTGSYTQGKLANTGKNYWTVEPMFGLFMNNPQKGQDFAAYAGFDFNQENSATNYKSGTQFHFETTYLQHFPLWGGAGGLGATGYYYQQLTGDSGSGARYGDFKGHVSGLGPVLSYMHKAGGLDVISELKWMHDLSSKNRPEGDTLFLKVVTKF